MPTPSEEPPEGDGWQHEIKYDGYRTQLHLTRSEARAFSHNGYDWTERQAHLLPRPPSCRATAPSSTVRGAGITERLWSLDENVAKIDATATVPSRMALSKKKTVHC